jgi:hypothetical protein
MHTRTEQLIVGVITVRALPWEARGAGRLRAFLPLVTLAFKCSKLIQVASLKRQVKRYYHSPS